MIYQYNNREYDLRSERQVHLIIIGRKYYNHFFLCIGTYIEYVTLNLTITLQSLHTNIPTIKYLPIFVETQFRIILI